MKRRAFRSTGGRGFTLIELLTAMAIIALLASILVPNFLHSLDKARLTACQTNLKNIATALQIYANDNDNQYPDELSTLVPSFLSTIPTCPAAIAETYSAGYAKSEDPANFTLSCGGDNHRACLLETGEPYYSLREGLSPKL